jgi:hypothetical protein
MEEAVKFAIDFYKAGSALCWYLPRGSFSDVKKIRKSTRIFQYERAKGRTARVFHPRLVGSAEVFSPDFSFFRGTSEFELVMDIYDCDYDRISSSHAVARWAGVEFPKATGLRARGKADAPDFGHAKKKTAGPSVTQFFAGGSSISHYSVNWLMIVVNIVLNRKIDLKKAILQTMKYFKGKYAVCWLLPRGNSGRQLKEIADNTFVFSIDGM